MKKLSIYIITLLLVVGLAACETGIVEIPVEPEEPVVPVAPDSETSNNVDTSPEVIVEFVDRFIEVPTEIERVRQYRPGTYMLAESRPNNQNGYIFAVVTIDDYGRIAGVYVDQTITTRNLFRSPEGLFYLFVPGNRSNIPDAYRLISLSTPVENYPTRNDAIRSTDLVVGIDTAAIRNLSRLTVNETKQMAAPRLPVNGTLDYQQQMRLVAEKIVADNTTYGFNLVELGDVLTTSSIDGITEALDVPLFLVQSILDGPARLSDGDELRSLSTPRYGVYHTGTYVEYSPTAYINNELIHGLSVVVVDAFGRLTGVHFDELVASTARESVVASKQILGRAAEVNSQATPWYEQANRLAQQVVLNQGIDGFRLIRQDTLATAQLLIDAPTLIVGNLSPINIRINEVLLAAQQALNKALFKQYVDGTYLLSSETNPNVFGYVTIQNQAIVDVFIDRFVLNEQATAFRRNQAVLLQLVTKQFALPAGNASGDILVYEINGIYYSVNAVTQLNDALLPIPQQLNQDQQVNLNATEVASLRAVPGWHTASSLRQTNTSEQTWFNDQESIAEVIQQQGNLTSFNVVDGRIFDKGINQIEAAAVLELVSQGLYQARDSKNLVFDQPLLAQTVPLADGSYIAHAAPGPNGAMSFTYMVVEDGNIITWVVDQTLLQNNRLTSVLLSDLPRREEWISLSDQLRALQHQIVTPLIEKPAPNPTIQSINTSLLLLETGLPNAEMKYADALDDVIRQATDKKFNQDIEWIRSYFNNDTTFFKDRTLTAFQTIVEWLPASIIDSELSHPYRLVWRTSNRDVTMTQEQDDYTVRVGRLDEDSRVSLELEIYLPNVNIPLSREAFELPLQRRTTFGQRILNSQAFDLPSAFVLSNRTYDLPGSDVVSVRWQSNQPAIFNSSGQVADVTQATTIELSAFVDLDANNQLGTNEPLRRYNITVLPLAQAISRVEAELDTNQMGEFIGNQLTVRTVSSVWGLHYTWSSNDPQVTIVTSGTISEVYVGALDFATDVSLTASFNAGNQSITKTFRADAGNKERYTLFATQDLPVITASNSMIKGQSLFESFNNAGRFYNSQISFLTTDFGQFVNAQGEIIYQHPTVDACFDIIVSAGYTGGSVPIIATSTDEFCVLSERSLLAQMNTDRDSLSDYVVSLRLTSHVDTVLQLPLLGLTFGHPIRWEVLANQEDILEFVDVSNLASGIVVMETSSGSLVSGEELRLRAIFEVAGSSTLLSTKEIVIEVRD